MITAHSHAMHTSIGNCYRLHDHFWHTRFADCCMGSTKKCGFKWQYTIAIGCRAFGKQHHGIAISQTLGDIRGLFACLASPFAFNEDSALQHCKESKYRPAFDFGLGDE